MARRLESNPTEVETVAGKKQARRATIERISFSAHADSLQTLSFVDSLKPPAIVLVHGEKTEMKRLRDELAKRKGAAVFMPPNGSTVALNYAETRLVSVMGEAAMGAVVEGGAGGGRRRLNPGVSGLLVHRDFRYLLVSPTQLAAYTRLSVHPLMQKLHVQFRGRWDLLVGCVKSMYADAVEEEPEAGGATTTGRRLSVVGGLVVVTHAPPDRVVLSWSGGAAGDMVADSLVALAAQAEVSHAAIRGSAVPCGGGTGGAGVAPPASPPPRTTGTPTPCA